MTVDWVRVVDLFDEATAAAVAVTESRLNMARAASCPMTRQRLVSIYDRLWTLACRTSRALAYRGKHAVRMRKRLEEGDKAPGHVCPPPPEQPTPLIDPVQAGHGIPRRVKRRGKKQLAADILGRQSRQ
jgi:hypothetical protein